MQEFMILLIKLMEKLKIYKLRMDVLLIGQNSIKKYPKQLILKKKLLWLEE